MLAPSEALPLVRSVLDDVDPEVRATAMRTAGRLGLDEMSGVLLERATSPDARVREAAIEALGQLRPRDGDQRAVDAALLRALTDADVTLRAAALRAVTARSTVPLADRASMIDAIATCLVDESPELRRLAAETLEKLKDRFALHALAARVDDASPEVRMAVARALGALDDPRAVPAVLRLVDDASEDVRATAITTLGQLAGASAVPRLQPFLTRSHDPLAGPAAVALGRIAAQVDVTADAATRTLRKRAADILVEAARRGDNRASALEGILLAKAAASRALETLLPTLGSRPADDVLLLAAELAASGDDATIELLLAKATLASDGRFDAPLARARPDAQGTRDRLVVWLASKLSDPGLMTRRAAAVALGTLGDPRASSALTALLHDNDAPTRRDALRALLGSRSAPPALLLESSRSDDVALRRVALRALAEQRDAPSRAALLAALGTPDESARQIAAQGLAQDAGAGELLAPLCALVKSGPRMARDPAMLALSGPLRGRPDQIARELCLSLAAGDDAGATGALEVLGAMRDGASVDRVIALLPRLARRPVRRTRAYAALGDLLLSGDRDNATRALVAALSDPDAAARASAAWALGKVPANSKLDGEVTHALRARLIDGSGIVRMNALAASARRGRVPDAETLQKLSNDGEVGVRANVARLRAQAPIAANQDPDTSGLIRNATAARLRSAALPPRGNDYLLLRLIGEGSDAALSARIGLADGLAVFFLADERGLVRDEAVVSGDLVVVSGEPTARTLD